MKTVHLVAPRTGPNNAGSISCQECTQAIFGENGEPLYDPEIATHTTDLATFAAAGSDDLPDYTRCTEN